MKKRWNILLIVIIAVCAAVALSYPIRYSLDDKSTQENMDRLLAMRDAGQESQENPTAVHSMETTQASGIDDMRKVEYAPNLSVDTTEPSAYQTDSEDVTQLMSHVEFPTAELSKAQNDCMVSSQVDDQDKATKIAPSNTESIVSGSAVINTRDEAKAQYQVSAAEEVSTTLETPDVEVKDYSPSQTSMLTSTPAPEPLLTPQPTPTVNRFERDGAIPYEWKQKRTLDPNAILPQYIGIYEENHDFVGWLTIPDTNIDYPVVQSEDNEFYLKHDFYGERNANGQIILDTDCDPYTPSYNLVISGHSMKSGKMFGYLVNYMYESYWRNHKIVHFDTLMEQKTYVVCAAFFSADYDVDEEGFRYNADIRYSLDTRQWLREIEENELYDTGIDAGFGDEFLTLTTCNRVFDKDGRFVVICRRLREGETIE